MPKRWTCSCPGAVPINVLLSTPAAVNPRCRHPQVFWEMFQVDAAVRAIVVTNDGVEYGWNDVCAVNHNGACQYTG